MGAHHSGERRHLAGDGVRYHAPVAARSDAQVPQDAQVGIWRLAPYLDRQDPVLDVLPGECGVRLAQFPLAGGPCEVGGRQAHHDRLGPGQGGGNRCGDGVEVIQARGVDPDVQAGVPERGGQFGDRRPVDGGVGDKDVVLLGGVTHRFLARSRRPPGPPGGTAKAARPAGCGRTGRHRRPCRRERRIACGPLSPRGSRQGPAR